MELKLGLLFSVFVIANCVNNDTQVYSLIIANKECNSDYSCTGDKLVYCDLKIHKCSCKTLLPDQNVTLVLLNDSFSCITGKNIGTGCTLHQECILSDPNSFCDSSFCDCQPSFSITNDSSSSCIMDTEKSTYHNVEVNTHMLPIMIVMGLMFVGMCVALNMFSKARFDDSSRGVFATTNPNARIVKSGSQRRRQRRPSRVPVHLEVVPTTSSSPDHSINFEPALEPLQSIPGPSHA